MGALGFMTAGCSATLLGIGLARFAYSPLLPAMVQAGWLGAGAAGALGAANLAGYLGGALAATSVGRRLGVVRALHIAMLLSAASFALCAIRGDLLWFLPWRVLAGFTGGVLMVLAGPAVQAAVPARMRGLASGVTIAGVGLGIVVGAVLVPALAPVGLPAAWLALCAAGFAVTAATWTLWPAAAPPPAARAFSRAFVPGASQLIATYGLAAMAATPHMLWWPDYVARGLGWGGAAAGLFWLLYGVAAAGGPTLCGALADRIGSPAAVTATLAAQVIAVLLPLLGHALPLLIVSAALAGLAALGITALGLLRSRELAGEAGAALWSLCTITWGAAQALAGFFLAWLYTATGTHSALFAAGLIAAALALALAARPFAMPYARAPH
jgi:predicted MFS family arabinose efflux permease